MVQAALYQLVLDRKVGEYELPEGASLMRLREGRPVRTGSDSCRRPTLSFALVRRLRSSSIVSRARLAAFVRDNQPRQTVSCAAPPRCAVA